MSVPIPQVLSWPLGGVAENGVLGYASDDESVREVIRNILLTRPGERLMRPQFGAGLLDFVHQPNNETTRNLMAKVIRKAIEQWETRVRVDAVEVLPDRGKLSVVQVNILYHMRHARQPKQLTFGIDLSGL
ncbi:MAG: GPW/gp25 family protein [Chromatiales bacterium]|jgi:phage baseplate assembly protein W